MSYTAHDGPTEATREQVIEILRTYWESRPRSERAKETAKRIGVSRAMIYAILKGSRKDIGVKIPSFFGYQSPRGVAYQLVPGEKK